MDMSITKIRMQTGSLSVDDLVDSLYAMGEAFAPKYFSTVDIVSRTSGSRKALLLKANDETVVGIGSDPNWSPLFYWVSLPSGESVTGPGLNGTYDTNPTAYICSNAILIAIDHTPQTSPPSKGGWMIFTKNDRNKTVLITSDCSLGSGSGSGDPFCSGIKCFGYDDDISTGTRASISFTQRVSNQLKLVPFVSCPPVGITSYTPNVFYIADRNCVLASSAVDWYECSLGGYKYLTNGYWAIKDDAIV